MYENAEQAPRAVLVGIDTGAYDAEYAIEELAGLAVSSGAQVVAKAVKRRKTLEAATLLGSGAMEEIRELCKTQDAQLLLFDCELTPSQLRNIEAATQVRVVDRTTLILDIFALRARSSEGRIQVELAQLKYLLPRLSGQGVGLSRLGGGIGTRGPGETKLETDRRHVRRRIAYLEEKLKLVEKRRAVARQSRKKNGFQTVALVGYTNAGKSTLMNALTHAGVLVQDQLFATLDPTARALVLPDMREVILIDTVGFISRLPHQLVQAFRSTLEVAAEADLILNVCDASDAQVLEQLEVTRQLLDELGCAGIPALTVLNKCDQLLDASLVEHVRDSVLISAAQGLGLEALLDAIGNKLGTLRPARFLFPYQQGGALARLRETCQVLGEEYAPEGYLVDAMVDVRAMEEFRQFLRE